MEGGHWARSARRGVSASALGFLLGIVPIVAGASHYSNVLNFSNSPAAPALNNTYVNRFWAFENGVSHKLRWWFSGSAYPTTAIADWEAVLPTDDWVDTEASSNFDYTTENRFLNVQNVTADWQYESHCGDQTTDPSAACVTYMTAGGGDQELAEDPGGRGGRYFRYNRMWVNVYGRQNPTGWVFSDDAYRMTTNHELGHVHGLADTACVNTGGLSSNTLMSGPLGHDVNRNVLLQCKTSGGTWITHPMVPTTGDRSDVQGFYAITAPSTPYSPYVVLGYAIFPWVDTSYADKYVYISFKKLVGGSYQEQDSTYFQANVSRRGQQLIYGYNASPGRWIACIQTYNAVYGFAGPSCTPYVDVS